MKFVTATIAAAAALCTLGAAENLLDMHHEHESTRIVFKVQVEAEVEGDIEGGIMFRQELATEEDPHPQVLISSRWVGLERRGEYSIKLYESEGITDCFAAYDELFDLGSFKSFRFGRGGLRTSTSDICLDAAEDSPKQIYGKFGALVDSENNIVACCRVMTKAEADEHHD